MDVSEHDERRWCLTGTGERDAVARGPQLARGEKVEVVQARPGTDRGAVEPSERTMTSVLADIMRAAYRDADPFDREAILRYVREAMEVDRQQRRGAVDRDELVEAAEHVIRASLAGVLTRGILQPLVEAVDAAKSEPSTDTGAVDPDATYQCPTCWGTGSIESSDSTDESWWDCRRCDGTGKLADRRRPQGAG